VPGDKSKGDLDHLSVGTALGQERKGKQGADRQEGSTPAASGQDAAPVPVQNTASGQDAATVPDQNTASGQDAAPHTASRECKVQKGSDGHEAVASKQESGPESQEQRGVKRTKEEIRQDELRRENGRLRRRIQEMQKDKPDLMRALNEKDWERAIELIKNGADVNVKDSPGMTTPLHLAAREIKADVVELLLEKRANANALTSRGQTPGGYCALASLAHIRTQESRWDEIRRIAKLLFRYMKKDTFAARLTTGKTLWHLLASQGKDRLLKLLLDSFETEFGRHDLVVQLNTLTFDHETSGRSVLDDAMCHRSCRNLLENKFGVNVLRRNRE